VWGWADFQYGDSPVNPYRKDQVKWWGEFTTAWKNIGKAHMEKVSPFLRGSDEEKPDETVEYEILRAVTEGKAKFVRQ
jgi:hypothetical protein